MPSADAVVLERTLRLVNIELHAVALQRRRLASSEPEDDDFDFRWWTDLQFFILALWRLRRYAEIVVSVPSATGQIRLALDQFDRAVPALRVMRNIGEHGDEYAVDSASRQVKSIHARQLEVGAWDGQTYQWLGRSLNVDQALAAGKALFEAVKAQSWITSTRANDTGSTNSRKPL
jgi:hypothetical protein